MIVVGRDHRSNSKKEGEKTVTWRSTGPKGMWLKRERGKIGGDQQARYKSSDGAGGKRQGSRAVPARRLVLGLLLSGLSGVETGWNQKVEGVQNLSAFLQGDSSFGYHLTGKGLACPPGGPRNVRWDASDAEMAPTITAQYCQGWLFRRTGGAMPDGAARPGEDFERVLPVVPLQRRHEVLIGRTTVGT